MPAKAHDDDSATRRPMRYRRFAIRISSAEHDGFDVSVTDSPAGEASDSVKRMVDVNALESLRDSLVAARHVETLDAEGRARPLDSTETRDLLERVGSELYGSLIPGGVRPIWDESRGLVDGPEEGLRLEIHMDPRDPAMLPVASLPWELAFHVGTGAFLGLDRSTSIVRYLDLGRKARGMSFDRPLRVLIAESRPRGLPGLGLDLEAERLKRAWGSTPGVELLHLRETTAPRLRARLTSQEPHVLHFMGHGYSDPSSGWGGMVLESKDRAPDEVGGRDLSDLFQGLRGLELVVLNACDTARPGALGRPFAGAAAGLVQAGVPAVVAMQFPISDRAAIVFSDALYRNLAQGRGIDEAVVEGRMAIRLDDRRSIEWITPALFLRGGQLGSAYGTQPWDQSRANEGSGESNVPTHPESTVQQKLQVGEAKNVVTVGNAGSLTFRSSD